MRARERERDTSQDTHQERTNASVLFQYASRALDTSRLRLPRRSFPFSSRRLKPATSEIHFRYFVFKADLINYGLGALSLGDLQRSHCPSSLRRPKVRAQRTRFRGTKRFKVPTCVKVHVMPLDQMTVFQSRMRRFPTARTRLFLFQSHSQSHFHSHSHSHIHTLSLSLSCTRLYEIDVILRQVGWRQFIF